MKHIKHLFTALLLLCSTVASAHDFEVNGIFYNILSEEDKTVEVTYEGESEYAYVNWYNGKIVIPESVNYNGNTYSVTSIGSYASWGCTELTSVTIPNSVTSIGNQAFDYCPKLKYIIIGENVTSIAFNAFRDCNDYRVVINFSQLTFTKGSTDYGEIAAEAFKVINNPENIDNFIFSTVDNTLEVYIGDETELVLPNNYSGKDYSISADAFSGQEELKRIEIPNCVTSIGDKAFHGCTGLTSVTIGDSVTSIGEVAFGMCTGLTSMEIPNSVTSIGEAAFYNCSELASVTIGNGVTHLPQILFSGCTNLKNVKIPNSVISIGDIAASTNEGVFEGCRSLTNIDIPSSVTTIGEGAFLNSGLTSIQLPNSVTNIGGYAFYGCTGLTSIEIPNSVTSIGDWAFSGCTGLTSVSVESETPPTIYSDTFLEVSATLYVPYGTKAAYEAADYWSSFTNIVEMDPTEITITVNEYGCGTYCSEYALDFSEVEGLKAYSAIGFNTITQVVTLARVMTTVAETGIFVKGEPGEYTVPIIEECNEHTLNLLVGTLESTTVNSTADGMSNFKFTITETDTAPMFYPFEDNTTFSAGKAYLQIPTAWLPVNAQSAISARFDDGETTDIEEVKGENEKLKGVCYDMQGRVVENPGKGIYIIDGKKVLVK